MADTSLDDFFAKKDKSKKKSKSKKNDLDDVSKEKKKKEKKDKDNSGGGFNIANAKDEEEWKDFEEEKEVDLKGLRIQNMQIGKDEENKDVASAEDDDDSEDGENTDRKRGTAGPWNKGEQVPNTKARNKVPEAPATPVEPKKDEAPAPKSTGKYVPPGARYSSQASTPSSFPSRRKKEAPNMNSEDDFPTLGGGPAVPRSYSSSNSGDFIDNPRGKATNLSLENRFSTLQD